MPHKSFDCNPCATGSEDRPPHVILALKSAKARRKEGEAMSEDKPLHVRVAEALGLPDVGRYRRRSMETLEWERCDDDQSADWYYHWLPDTSEPRRSVPHYDTDWSATGPLIDEWELDILHTGLPGPGCVSISGLAHCPTGRPGDEPYGGAWLTIEAGGPTTPIAVCHWLLAAHEKGACVSENLRQSSATTADDRSS
jgi:hypothetical protein